MPRRTDISSILVIGSGPIVIGQASEFDYSGTQACRVLMEEGFRVILVNSNPATIMTDPEFASATYLEPITPEFVEQVIALERPDALLATLGGQTALNCAVQLHERGVLEKYDLELIGASVDAIQRGENRETFKQIVEGLTGVEGGPGEVARSTTCHSMTDVLAAADELGYPLVVRPSFTMGGVGSGFAHDETELRRIAGAGLSASPTTEVLIEESILGWKEYELEVMRDRADNVVIVCSIENLDPMGVHTGDSITVAPALTLTDREYQRMRDVSIGIIRAVGVETGGCNIQFAVDPRTGRMIVIEMNPRVSRSSALASKATGFPIAKIAAKVAIGYTLDEIPNDITTPKADDADTPAGAHGTPASFEPTLDYVVVKVPRFAFEKFPSADSTLTTHMKSVGEAMAIGRNFTEALGKALRSLEDPRAPFDYTSEITETVEELLSTASRPHDGRLGVVLRALRAGATVEQLHAATWIDPWFLDQLVLLLEVATEVEQAPELTADVLRLAKRHGFSDAQIAALRSLPEEVVRGVRWALGVRPVFKTVDTCAAEFAARTPYHYSSYDSETEVRPRTTPAVLILGSGPNRIGQGIEFDYSCVHASMALSAAPDNDGAGYETIMVNCNPETVSTDYDTSDRLYFEPLTCEDVLEVVHAETLAGPVAGVVVQLGGQTPLRLAQPLKDAGVPIVGTSPEAIHLAEERGAFGDVLAAADLPAPKHGMARSFDEAKRIADEIGYPVLVRPSYVLGGRGMEIVYDEPALSGYIERATDVSPAHPVLVDRFLDDAVEIDVDALYDGTDLYLGGVMEHIEEAGIHSGDSACALPPITLGAEVVDRIRVSTEAIAEGVGVRGLLNIQFALAGDTLYVLEANPRASRTVPFVSKATATPLAKAAARIMLGATIADLRAEGMLRATGDGSAENPAAPIAVKEAVMPFNRFRTVEGVSVDTILGPEMKSTGEVMGLDVSFGVAFAKSQVAGFGPLPTQGTVFISVANRDKRHVIFPVKRLADLGFEILATAGTASMLRRHAVPVRTVRKHSQGPGPEGEPTIVQAILDSQVDLIFNTPHGLSPDGRPRYDGYEIRTAAVLRNVPCITTVQGLAAAVQGIEAIRAGDVGVRSLQSWHSAAESWRRATEAGEALSADPDPAAEPVRTERGPRSVRGRVLEVGYRRVARPVLFTSYGGDAERVHEATLAAVARLGGSPAALRAVSALVPRPRTPVTVAGIHFPGPVGVAAGLDKNGVGVQAWSALGFSHAELGTVTARPQPGNDRPRLFRLPRSQAILNRMGFNNLGAAALAERLRAAGVRRGNGAVGMPLGVSIGKTATTPLPEATEDYLISFRTVAPYADYVAVNVSSPNTVGLRSLQDRAALHELVVELVAEAALLAGPDSAVPVFVKIAPDLSDAAVDELLEVCLDAGISGLVATNTTVGRDGLHPADAQQAVQAGGLSGGPLTARARQVVRYLTARSDLPVIGVGGILTADDARAMLDAGARLLQLYTGYIYAGPALVAQINGLAAREQHPTVDERTA